MKVREKSVNLAFELMGTLKSLSMNVLPFGEVLHVYGLPQFTSQFGLCSFKFYLFFLNEVRLLVF